MAQAEAPPVDTDAEITANSELTGDEDEELLESKVGPIFFVSFL